MRQGVSFALASALAVLGHAGDAQTYRDQPPALPVYRDGQPEVLTSPAAAPDPARAQAAAFGSRYERAGSPRVMILWNRTFSDDVRDRYQDHLHVQDDRYADGTSTQSVAQNWYGASARTDTSGQAHRTLDAVHGSERSDSARGSTLAEGVDWRIEAALSNELEAHGVRLADRSTALRTAAAETKGDAIDGQTAETRGALQASDWLVEILQTTDPDAPTGVTFKISVKEIRTARVLVMLTSTGRPPARHMPFVAGSYGYVRAIPPSPSPEEVGRQLALDLMVSVSSRI